MYTQPLTSPPPGPQNTAPVSPSRPSRLRGLSYLRNYTHNHILARDHSSNSNSNGNSGATSPTSRTADNLTRSISYDPAPSSATRAQALAHLHSNTNRLTLVSSTPDQSQSRSASRQTAPSTPSTSQASQQAGESTAPAPQPSTGEPADGQANMTRARASTNGEQPSGSPEATPSIRFSAYYDPRSTRPSLTFSSITRTLPNSSDIIRVGRYSERDNQAAASQVANQPSAAPVGFKSKVVSRRHCEFWSEDGKWYIKDVKSSSGTFLNHIRLSAPSQESKAFPINDGDIIQLGIDFKGGEEMIFRCVKMRVELNRGWQNKLNTFNVAAHKRLRTMAAENGTAGTGSSSQDCSICLNSIAPCQSLFVAPCSHTWHFKCVRSLLTSPQYPIFICPNCRAGADLEADVDDPAEDWEQVEDEKPSTTDDEAPVPKEVVATDEEEGTNLQDIDAMDVTVNVISDSPAQISNATSEPVLIRSPPTTRTILSRNNRTPSPPGNGAEGPITPSNNAGPWVFDGSAGRRCSQDQAGMVSLDAAADMDMNEASTSEDSVRE